MTMRSRWMAIMMVLGYGTGVCLAEQTVRFSDGPGDIGGGEFTAYTSNHGTFLTFCLEYYEGLDVYGGTVYDYTISTDSMWDGGGFGNTDPLDARTAFLFQCFTDGLSRDVLGDQGLSDIRVANAMQIAIWDIEDEGVDFSFHADYANSRALIAAAQTAIDDGEWSGLGGVRVMNNWVSGMVGEEGGASQDTLIIVPLPSAAGLATIGICAFGAVIRRRS